MSGRSGLKMLVRGPTLKPSELVTHTLALPCALEHTDGGNKRWKSCSLTSGVTSTPALTEFFCSETWRRHLSGPRHPHPLSPSNQHQHTTHHSTLHDNKFSLLPPILLQVCTPTTNLMPNAGQSFQAALSETTEMAHSKLCIIVSCDQHLLNCTQMMATRALDLARLTLQTLTCSENWFGTTRQ